MCGFAGAFRRGGGEVCSADTLVRMRDRMAHRGPDGAGLWRSPEGDCALVHRRLSIIDLSEAAAQPMANDDGSVVLAFNGEIYNHAELRRELEAPGRVRFRTDHSDTEVLLRAYEAWGIASLERLHGMFAFAIVDRRDRERPLLHLVRDRAGVKPLYLARTSRGEWLFGSEIRALLAHPDLRPEMDRTALWHYLTFIVAPAPLTLFRGIFKIPAGHGVTIDHRGEARAWCWWDCRPSRDTQLTEDDLTEDEAVDELGRLLRRAIARRMVSDVPFGVLLSGGVDSSLNVVLMSELMERPVSTFTIGYEGEESFNEFEHARRVSARYRTDHHEARITRDQVEEFLPLLVRLQDEPIADNVCIPLYFLAESVRAGGCTVVQVGEGADENLLGYWWCDHYLKKAIDVYEPARRGANARLARLRDRLLARHRAASQEDREIRRRAERGEELFWGGAVCWWGELRERLTPVPRPFRESIECPVEGLLPDSHRELDSHGVVAHHLGALTGALREPEVLGKIPYMEM
ncbi:MAG: asparagine synthase (glutamine-hydrolyzing), partial [Planctomycetota bacterium]